MEDKFELKDITMENSQNNSRKYTLNFSNGKRQESITLTGNGKLKETVKI